MSYFADSPIGNVLSPRLGGVRCRRGGASVAQKRLGGQCCCSCSVFVHLGIGVDNPTAAARPAVWLYEVEQLLFAVNP